MDREIDMAIQPVWDTVRKLHKQVDAALRDYPKALRTAATMTASELVENSIKYPGVGTNHGRSASRWGFKTASFEW